MKLRNTIMLIVALLTIVLVNGLIIQKERLISHGQTIFLELAPVDPRSLIQGDYMRLRYALAQDVRDRIPPADGYLVLRMDERNIARNEYLTLDEIFPSSGWLNTYLEHKWQGFVFCPPKKSIREKVKDICLKILDEEFGISIHPNRGQPKIV